VRDVDAAKKQARQMGYLAAGVIIFAVCLCGVLLGLMYAANEASKEMHVVNGVEKDLSGDIVKTGSAEMEVDSEGNLVGREGSGPLATRPALRTQDLHSRLADSYFTSLRRLTLNAAAGSEGFVAMEVLATARYPKKGSRCGTIVTIFTHLGEIILDDSDVYFEEAIVNSFTMAGFKQETFLFSNFGGKRRLQSGAAMLKGLFDAIAKIEAAQCGAATNPIKNYRGLIDGPVPDTPRGDFELQSAVYYPCESSTPGWCEDNGAAAHPSDYQGKLFFSSHRTTITGVGNQIYQKHNVSWDNSSRTVQSLYSQGSMSNWETTPSGQKFNCNLQKNYPSMPNVKFADTAEYHGDEFVVMGYPARKFTFTYYIGSNPDPSKPGTGTYEVWDSKATNKILRMKYSEDYRAVGKVAEEMGAVMQSLTHFEDVHVLKERKPHDETVVCALGACLSPFAGPNFDGCIDYNKKKGVELHPGRLYPVAVSPPLPPSSARRLAAAQKAKVSFSDAGESVANSLKGNALKAHNMFMAGFGANTQKSQKTIVPNKIEIEMGYGSTGMMIDGKFIFSQPEPWVYGVSGDGSIGGSCEADIPKNSYLCKATGCIGLKAFAWIEVGKLEMCMSFGFGSCTESKGLTVGFFGLSVALTIGNSKLGVSIVVDLSLSMLAKKDGGCQHSITFTLLFHIAESDTKVELSSIAFGSRRRLVADHFNKASRLLQSMGQSDDVLANAKGELESKIAKAREESAY